MQRVPCLNWPANLFCDDAAIFATTAPLFHPKPRVDDNLCACGCKRRHQYAVSRVVETQRFGIVSRSVAWYANMDCRNRHMGFVR